MGSYTTNGYFYKPDLGASGSTEKGYFDTALDGADSQIGTNKTNIATNTSNISTNTSNISTLDGSVLKKDGSVALTANWDLDGAHTLYIDKTNGRVGIGTTSPSKKLTVQGDAYIGDITNSDYTEIESDGTIVCHGDAKCYVDQRIDWGQLESGSWFGNEYAEPVELGAGIGIEFQNSTTEGYKVRFNCQLDHKYAEGEDIEFHIHIRNDGTSTGNAVFKFTYEWANMEGTFPTATSVSKTIAIDGTDKKHQYETIATLTGTGKEISSILMCTLERDAGNASDTFSGSVYVIGIDFHIPVNMLGSREMGTK